MFSLFLVHFDIISNIFIIILQYLHYKLSECTYSSNRLKYLQFKLLHLNKNLNFSRFKEEYIISLDPPASRQHWPYGASTWRALPYEASAWSLALWVSAWRALPYEASAWRALPYEASAWRALSYEASASWAGRFFRLQHFLLIHGFIWTVMVKMWTVGDENIRWWLIISENQLVKLNASWAVRFFRLQHF